MTWSYDPTLATDKDRVRFEIQDTDTSDQLFPDETLTYLLNQNGATVKTVAFNLASKLLVQYARQCDTTVGRVSESASQRYQAMKELVSRLEGDLLDPVPAFGGISNQENTAQDNDTDLVQPWETREGTSNTGNKNTFGGGN